MVAYKQSARTAISNFPEPYRERFNAITARLLPLILLIIGKFYEEECSGVKKEDDVYRVEKILKRKKVKGKNMVLVKWLGYDSKHNSWIPENSIQDIE